MIKVLIVDDEAPARSRLVRMLSSFSDLEVVGEAANGVEALQLVQSLKPDLLLLDIEMPELSGLEVAEALGGQGPTIVFVTAYSEHALRAFELSAMDYLVKPVSPERLSESVERIKKRKSAASFNQFQELMTHLEEGRAKRRMAVKCGSKYKVFDPAQISAVIAKDHYAVLIVGGQELTADDSLDALAKRLDTRKFLRIHRSAMINLDYLKELEHEGDRKYLAVLDDPSKTRLPVSRERLDELKKMLDLD
ncbi:MAG TPA: LytTR family DNA-binding domain-containing protein [bacterium]|jgi:DNA-binding LytR/AlgR family response regulator|nr:LytTR family DNA-binding domain-containing protein [bacterium]